MQELVVAFLEQAGFRLNVRRRHKRAGPWPCRRTRPDPRNLDAPRWNGLTVCQRLREWQRRVPNRCQAMGETHDKVSGLTQAPMTTHQTFDLESSCQGEGPAAPASQRARFPPSPTRDPSLVLSRWCVSAFEASGSTTRCVSPVWNSICCIACSKHGMPWPAPAESFRSSGLEPDDDVETDAGHIRHLRRKLEPNSRKPRFIKTVYGAGMLETSADSDPKQADSPRSLSLGKALIQVVVMIERPALRRFNASVCL